MWPIVTHAFGFGLVLSTVLCGLVLAVLWANPEIMLNDYPPDIRAKWGPMTHHTKRQRVIVVVALLVTVISIVVWSITSMPGRTGHGVTFVMAFMHCVIMFGTFNLIDWLCLDWSLVYWQPRFIVLPGTEGLAGYRDYAFHFRGFLVGIPMVLAASAFCAAVASILA